MAEFTTGTGQKLTKVHDRSECKGHNCCIHNPSDHHMVDFPLHWRDDRGFFERICPHGVGHPDPDEIEFHKKHGHDITVHGCDGCCNPNFKGFDNE